MMKNAARRMAGLVIVSTLLLGGAARAEDACTGYGAQLAAMAEADKALRGRQDYLAGPDDSGQARRQAQLDLVERSNAGRLQTLLARCGWPLRSVWGDAAGYAAWQLIRQYGQDLGLQRMAAPHLERAVAAGEAPGRELALLLDRIAVAEGRPQEHGTQMQQLGCRWVPQPMDDRARVEERRRQLGLPSLEEQERQANGMVIHEGCENHVSAAPLPQLK